MLTFSLDPMEIHSLLYLLFFFTIHHPAVNSSICKKGKKKGPNHIAYNVSKNGFCVELDNLTIGASYEFAITIGSNFNIHQENFKPKSTRIHFFLNNSCLTCEDEMITVTDYSKSVSSCRSITKQGCNITSNTEDPISTTIPSTCEDHISYIKPSTCETLISSTNENFIPSTVKTTSKDLISSTVQSTSKDLISSTVRSTSKDLISSTVRSTSKDLISSTVRSTSTDPISTTILSTKEVLIKDVVIICTSSIVFLLLLVCTFFVCRHAHRRKKRKRFLISPNRKKSGSSDVQGLVICCPCSEVHRQATKELLSLINNFTDLHATSYLDLKLCEEKAIPQLVQQLWDSASWIIVIESANFYHHSKEQDLKELNLCNLMASFSVQLLKHSTKAEHRHLKTIYRVSFDLEFKEFELSKVFPELNGHIYSLLIQSVNFGFSLNFDEIERFFLDLTCKQHGKSVKNLRRWTNNNWKESSEAKNLEKALVNRTDEMWNSSGCYSIDERYFSAEKSHRKSHLKKTYQSPWDLDGNNQPGSFQNHYDINEKESDSVGTFWDDSSFISSDVLSNKHSLMNQFPYLGKPKSVYSDISSKLQQINIETDARIIENFMKMNEEELDRIEELSV